ncbi:hypothetical protein GCM10009827_018820 [Dactylosporangium maewongense]|uniref:Uncharacterized protein n=1 Tax=Dactylosporangium maewongense TaxID=634393 RepID=A0ABN1ZVW8_9ACTN
MSTQLEQDLAATFGAHDGDVVDTSALADAAARRGRRLRARAYAVRGAALVAVVAAAGAVTVSRSPGVPGPAAQASQSAGADWIRYPPPGGWSVPGLPAVAVPADPSRIGTDPALLHFTVDEWSVVSPYATWRSTGGVETIEFARDGATYKVSLAKTTALLDRLLEDENRDPAGHLPTATDRGDGLFVFTSGPMQRFYYQRWQPVPGVWAQLFAEDAATADAARIKARVRLDVTLRCAAPVQLTALPAGAGLLGCETTLAGNDLPGRLLFATLWAGENTVDRAEISMMRVGLSATSAAPTLTIGGHPAAVFTDDRFRPSVEFPDVNGLRIHIAGTGTYTSPALLTIAEGIRVARAPFDPSTWADRLVT